MKCPSCGYEHGWNNDSNTKVEGKEGDFFELPIKMEQRRQWDREKRSTLHACPSCGVAFIDPKSWE